MTPHTPGPWQLYLGRAGEADGLGYIRPVDEDGREIAHHGDLLRSRDENLANGHLIAAAPSLLAAAEEVLRVYMPQFPDSRAVDDCLVGLAMAVASALTQGVKDAD